jgi:catalase
MGIGMWVTIQFFFVKDGKNSVILFILKKGPHTNMKSPTMMWDFWSLNPESLHQVLILMSDRGTPYGYRHMNGYGSHTYSMLDEANQRIYVKSFQNSAGNQEF